MGDTLQTVSITSTSGFVGHFDTSKDVSLWNKPGGVNFVVFMVIGFCATLAFIAVVVITVFFVRRYLIRQRARQQADEEATATVLEPKKLYVVVHPGGTADVAHREDDDQPRKLVLKSKPVELSAAVIGVEDSIPAEWDRGCGKDADLEVEDEQLPEVLEEVAIEIYPLQDTARNQSYSRRSQSRPSRLRPSAGTGHGQAASNPSREGERCPPSEDSRNVPHLQLHCRGIGMTPRTLHGPGEVRAEQGNAGGSAIELLVTHRSAASEEHSEDLRLLTQRYR